MNQIKVIDAPCGFGKTSFAIQMINETPDQQYIYCTPFLDEVERIIESTGSRRFCQPEYFTRDDETQSSVHITKCKDFQIKLQQGNSIALTHSCFLNSFEELKAAIEPGKYILCIDETLELLQKFNATTGVANNERQKTDGEDIENLLDSGYISISPEDGNVRWIGKHWEQFAELERLSRLGQIYCPRKTMLMRVFPAEVFSLFKEVFVVMSQLTLSSQWVPFEVGIAAQRDLPTATFLRAEVPMPSFLEYWPRLKQSSDIKKYIEAKRQVDLEYSHSFHMDQYSSATSKIDRFYTVLKRSLS